MSRMPSAARVLRPPKRPATLADFLDRLGGIPAERILFNPPPGTATEADLLACVPRSGSKLVELIDGTLVEKPVGADEGFLEMWLAVRLGAYVELHGYGVLGSSQTGYRMPAGNVRLPDISFVPYDRLPAEGEPRPAFHPITPEFFVEVISPSNTVREIELKIREFFAAGCKLAWAVDHRARTVKVYKSAGRSKVFTEGTLDAGPVLPGFKVELDELFASATPTRKPKKK